MLLTTLGKNPIVFELEVEKGYMVKSYLDDYKKLIEYLGLKCSPDHIFKPSDFLAALNKSIPKNFRNKPSYLILHQDEMGIDGKRIGLGGFSAGATLSLGVVIKSIQEGTGGYRCCVLGYPMTSALMEDQDKDSDFPVGDEEMVQAMNLFTNGEEKNP